MSQQSVELDEASLRKGPETGATNSRQFLAYVSYLHCYFSLSPWSGPHGQAEATFLSQAGIITTPLTGLLASDPALHPHHSI